MSNDLNLCQFIGRLGQDPETKYLPSGDAVTTISIAVGSTWKDKNSGEKNESTEWIRVTAFRRVAEIMAEYLRKGSQVYISGRFRTQKWQDKSGNDRYSTDIVADRMQMLGGKRDGERSGASEAPTGSARVKPESQSWPTPDDFDDDIPF